jgi:hypothetical protein
VQQRRLPIAGCRSAPRYAFATADASRFASTTAARGSEVETSTCRQQPPEPSGYTRQDTSQCLQVCENQRQTGWDARPNVRFRRQSGHHDNSGKCLLLTQSGHRVPDKVQDMAQRIATVLSAQLGSKSGADSRAFVVRQLTTLHALDLSDSQASPGAYCIGSRCGASVNSKSG